MRFTRTPGEHRPQAEVLRLWHEYRASDDPRLRERLVLTFAPLVKSLAFGKKRGLPAHVPVDELISSGLEALIRSLDRYDPAKGATLEQFLWLRIRGAMVDDLRGDDFAPRSLRATEREVSHARNEFRAIHRRQPSDEEIASAVGMTEERLHAHQLDMHMMSSVGSLNVRVGDEERTSERGDLLIARDGDPEAAAFSDVDSDTLSTALNTLSDRERTIVALRYFHQMTLVEIGQIVGLSNSRVSTINAQAKGKLREQLAGGDLARAA